MSEQPFPGLRAFRRNETDVFFGRESSLDIMVARLTEHRFLAVTGASGAGKSSLVFTGLINALHRGLLWQAGSDWTIVKMRPGAHPFQALATELPAPEAAEGEGALSNAERASLLREMLMSGPLALAEYLGGALGFAGRQNVLVVVDQFEELFR